jgi:hypothetical protein
MRFITSFVTASLIAIGSLDLVNASSNGDAPKKASISDLRERARKLKERQETITTTPEVGPVQQDAVIEQTSGSMGSTGLTDRDSRTSGGNQNLSVSGGSDLGISGASASKGRRGRRASATIEAGQKLVGNLMAGYAEQQNQRINTSNKAPAKKHPIGEPTPEEVLTVDEFFTELELILRETDNIKRKSRMINFIHQAGKQSITGDSVVAGNEMLQRLTGSVQFAPNTTAAEAKASLMAPEDQPLETTNTQPSRSGLVLAFGGGAPKLKRAGKTLAELEAEAAQRLKNMNS